MNNYLISEISSVVIHHVGNKLNDDGIVFSKTETHFDKQLKDILISYFVKPFKSKEYYNFTHNSDLNLNEVFFYVSKIFESPDSIFDESINIVKHLYDCSKHPKIKGGEFYVIYFKDCVFEGQTIDAIGLFKSENKDTFLKVRPINDNFQIEINEGINISNLDKGCLIFNTAREKGFVVSVVDKVNKGDDTIYWFENFLKLTPRKDNYNSTQDILSLCKKFITKELPQQFEISKADQVSFLNKSLDFFKEKDSFDMDEFTNEVMEQPQFIEQFNKYKNEYESKNNTVITENFTISNTALKKQVRSFKRVIKLDKNFDIYIHGNKDMIERGVDVNTGRKYYKIYYEIEV